MKAACYVRCSTDQQKEDSPEQQTRELQAFADQRGYEIVDWYTDVGKSGTTFDQRPEFQRLRAVVESGTAPFRTVLCYDASRWGRALNSRENGYWAYHFKRHGVDVVFVKTHVEPSHEFAPMLESFEGVMASQYSKHLSDLTLRGQRNNGKYSSGGTAPYGYSRIAVNLHTGAERPLASREWCVKKQEKVYWALGAAEEVETVRFIFQERSRGLACVVIAKMLNERGVPCAKRGKWHNKDQRWSAGTIRSILTNPAYYGARVFNRYSSSKIVASRKGRELDEQKKAPVWKNDKSEWVITENAHPAIVSKELWERAQAVGRHPKNNLHHHQPKYRSRYLLTGLVRCSKCGFPFQGWSGKVNGKEYLRYIDGGWQTKRVCEFLSIPRDFLEEYALNAVRATLADPFIFNQIEEHLARVLAIEPSQHEEECNRLRKELDATDRKISNFVREIEEGNSSPSVREGLAAREREKENLQRQLKSLVAHSPSQAIADTAHLVRDFVSGFDERFATASQEERKVMLQRCIAGIIIEREMRNTVFDVRRIPAVTPEIEEALKAMANEGFLSMSKRSARNRT